MKTAGAMVWAAMVLLCSVAAHGQVRDREASVAGDPRVQKVRAIQEEFNAAERKASEAWAAAKTEEEKQKAMEAAYPSTKDYARRFLELAREKPEDEAARDALLWMVQRAGNLPEAEEAVKLLTQAHARDPKIGEACQSLAWNQSPAVEAFLFAVLEQNPNREAKGQACLALGQYWKSKAETDRRLARNTDGPAALSKAESYLERAAKEFADVKHWRGNVADAAKGELFEMRNLAIGKAAPEIEGKDIDGKPMKLSEFRGKVVVIDFWGDW